MKIKKEKDIEENLDLNEATCTVNVEEPEFSPEDYIPFETVLQKDDEGLYIYKHGLGGLGGAHFEQAWAPTKYIYKLRFLYVIFFIYVPI